MFQVSMWEISLIIVIALIALGPRQLAEAAKVVGRLYRELTKLTDDLRSSIDLDSLTADPGPPEQHHYDPGPPGPPPAGNSSQDGIQEMHELTDPNGRTGADFYAELLEQSREDEPSESEAAADEAEVSTEKQSVNGRENDEGKRNRE